MTTQRYHAIDALRGLAALCVVLYHLALYYDETYDLAGLTVPGWFEAFRYGPHFFYMISGFVILMTLSRHPGFLPFLRARLIRLLPAFWVCLPIATMVGLTLAPEDMRPDWMDVVTNAFFLQGVTGYDHVDLAYWSLLIEMAFYLLAGLFVARLNLGHRLTLLLWVWLAISLVGMIYYNDLSRPLEVIAHELLIVRYSIFFIPGIVFFLAEKEGRLCLNHKLLITFCCVFMVLSLPLVYGLLMTALTFVLWAAIKGRFNRLLCHNSLLWLGAISYPLYLVHQVLGIALIYQLQVLGVPSLVCLALAIILSIALAHLIHRFVEKKVWKKLGRAA